MPTSAEAIIAMLATVRIGAIHCVVFAGFGAGALGDRIRASGSRLVLTTDVTYRKGKDVDLLAIVDDAIDAGPSDVEHVVVLRRTDRVPAAAGRRAGVGRPPRGRGGPTRAPSRTPAAEDPAFILATSGTTAKPKLAVHTHGGYAVHIAAMGDWVFGLRAGDTWWSTSDIGWVVGHSYIVYAPLMAGATTLAYEGAIDHPDADAPWAIIERERVTGVFTSPTAIRLLMRYGEEIPRRHDLGGLERVFSRRRGAERAGLGVAAANRVRRPRAGHRPHVADRDRRADLRQPVRLSAPADQARIRRGRAARHRGGRRRPRRPAGRGRARRGSCGSSGRSPA